MDGEAEVRELTLPRRRSAVAKSSPPSSRGLLNCGGGASSSPSAGAQRKGDVPRIDWSGNDEDLYNSDVYERLAERCKESLDSMLEL